jgi:hypothetical protein
MEIKMNDHQPSLPAPPLRDPESPFITSDITLWPVRRAKMVKSYFITQRLAMDIIAATKILGTSEPVKIADMLNLGWQWKQITDHLIAAAAIITSEMAQIKQERQNAIQKLLTELKHTNSDAQVTA